MSFPGPHEPDEAARQERHSTQFAAVFALMSDGAPRTLDQISREVEARGVRCPPASASAQLRHFRKPEFGGHTLTKRHVGKGLYEYRLHVTRKQAQLF